MTKDKRKVFFLSLRAIYCFSQCRVHCTAATTSVDRLSWDTNTSGNAVASHGQWYNNNIPRNYIEIRAIPALSTECVWRFGAAPLCIWTAGVGVILEGKAEMKASQVWRVMYWNAGGGVFWYERIYSLCGWFCSTT